MQSVEDTLAERGARYGIFYMHAQIAQGLKEVLWAQQGWNKLAADQRQSLEVICDKMARILNGDPDYLDNWLDIEGYSRLVRSRLEEEHNPVSKPLGLLASLGLQERPHSSEDQSKQ